MQDLARDVEDWIARYDRELEEFESKALQMNIQQEQVEARHTVLKTVYERRQQEMNDWLAYKEKRRQEEEYKDRCEDAASKIQVSLVLLFFFYLYFLLRLYTGLVEGYYGTQKTRSI